MPSDHSGNKATSTRIAAIFIDFAKMH